MANAKLEIANVASTTKMKNIVPRKTGHKSSKKPSSIEQHKYKKGNFHGVIAIFHTISTTSYI
jgi:hypothetical protein